MASNKNLIKILESIIYSEGLKIKRGNEAEYGYGVVFIRSLRQQYAPYLLSHEFGHYLHDKSLNKLKKFQADISYNLRGSYLDTKAARKIRITTERSAWNYAKYILKTIDFQFNKNKFKKYSTKCIQTYRGIY